MANKQSIKIRKSLKSIFTNQFINSKSRETGFVQREGKIKPVPFFWTLILGFGVGTKKNISTLRRSFQRSTGVEVVPSSFYDRFNDRLVKLLKVAVGHTLKSFKLTDRALQGSLSRFEDILITDSTLITLNKALAHLYKGVRTNVSPASAKLHSVFSVTGCGKSTIKVTSGSVHDRKKFVVNKWVKNKLLIFDLGYCHFQLFKNIVRAGGQFITRIKQNSDPIIVGVFNGSKADNENFIGHSLKSVLYNLRRDTLDVTVEVKARSRVYNGRVSYTKQRFRLVAIRNKKTKSYHSYLTSIPANLLSAKQVASCYRARWEIELIFKELKSGYRLDDIESKKKSVVDSLILSSVITLIVSRKLFRLIAFKIPKELQHRVTPGRWWRVFAEYAQELLYLVVRPPREAVNLSWLFKVIKNEIIDPHTKRKNLLASTLGLSQLPSNQGLMTP